MITELAQKEKLSISEYVRQKAVSEMTLREEDEWNNRMQMRCKDEVRDMVHVIRTHGDPELLRKVRKVMERYEGADFDNE